MLQHEQEQPLETPAAPETPAARMRVTSEELASAIGYGFKGVVPKMRT